MEAQAPKTLYDVLLSDSGQHLVLALASFVVAVGTWMHARRRTWTKEERAIKLAKRRRAAARERIAAAIDERD